MNGETSTFKSFGMSLVLSSLMIALAIHLQWNVVDLSKCFLIATSLSTVTLCFLLVFSLLKIAPSKIFGLILFMLALYLSSSVISLYEELHDELASSFNDWEARDKSLKNGIWLLQICKEYLPFTALLTIKLAMSFISKWREPNTDGLFEGLRFEIYGHAILVFLLILTLMFISPSLESQTFYLTLIIIVFLPWQELLSRLGRLQGGY